ncbi:MAG: hypothetical protein GX616_10270, partial [Planctomycetes bacterium]|nr:hypothetical protein [Planctomycetota bacterium]
MAAAALGADGHGSQLRGRILRIIGGRHEQVRLMRLRGLAICLIALTLMTACIHLSRTHETNRTEGTDDRGTTATATQPAADHHADGLTWGEPVNGLQVAMEPVPDQKGYPQGEWTKLRFRVRNVSDHTIQLAAATTFDDCRDEIRDEDGKTWYGRQGLVAAIEELDRIVRHHLKPGQEAVIDSRLGLNDKWLVDWRQPEREKPFLDSRPRRYEIRYELRLSSTGGVSPDGTMFTSQADDWQGTLKTGWRKVVFKPSLDADAATAVAEAVPLPIDLAGAFEANPGRGIDAHEGKLRIRWEGKVMLLEPVGREVRASWSDGSKQNEAKGKILRIDLPAWGGPDAVARDPVVIDVKEDRLRFRGCSDDPIWIRIEDGQVRVYEFNREGQYRGSYIYKPTTVPETEPAETRPAPGGDAGGRSGDLPYGTAETLGGLREPSAVEALIAALKDEDVGVRGAAARALGRIGDVRAVGPLIELYHDRKHESFKDALRALGEIGGEKATAALVEALQDQDEYARNFAARGLEKSGWKPADRQQRIRYLLALDKWDEAVAAGPAAKPSDEAANQAEGPFELDIPIVIALKKGDEGRGGFPRHSVVQFKIVEKRLQAVLDVCFSSWPQTKWLFTLDVLDAAGKVLDQATATHVTSGMIRRIAFAEREEIQFRFGGAADPAKVVGFRIGVESVSTNQGNPIAFDEELPLRLALNAIEYSNAIEAKWIRFDRSKDRFGASVRVSLLSWPKAKYRVRVEIPGPENRVLAHAEQVIESSGIIETYPYSSEETLRFDLGSTEVLEETTELVRYGVWLERVDGQTGAESQPSSAGLQGTVLLPDGKPAVGAQVVLLLAEHEARFVDGRFEREMHNRTERRPDGISAVTDADGRFAFPQGSAFFAIAILHDEGYIELPAGRLTGSPITLRPWARVEGVVLGLDKFKTSRPVDYLVTYRTYDRSGLGERGWQQENANINLRYSITPDSQGRFVLDRVPPGQCWIRREWIRPLAHGEVHQNAGEMCFETRPGQTTRVRVGAARRVVGRLLAAVDADFQ